MAGNCEFEKSVDYFQQAIDFNMAAKNLWGVSRYKKYSCALCILGFGENVIWDFNFPKRRFNWPRKAEIITLREWPMAPTDIHVLPKDIWMRRKNIF